MKNITKCIVGLFILFLIGCTTGYKTPQFIEQTLFCQAKGMTYKSGDYKYDSMWCTDNFKDTNCVDRELKIHFYLNEVDFFISELNEIRPVKCCDEC